MVLHPFHNLHFTFLPAASVPFHHGSSTHHTMFASHVLAYLPPQPTSCLAACPHPLPFIVCRERRGVVGMGRSAIQGCSEGRRMYCRSSAQLLQLCCCRSAWPTHKHTTALRRAQCSAGGVRGSACVFICGCLESTRLRRIEDRRNSISALLFRRTEQKSEVGSAAQAAATTSRESRCVAAPRHVCPADARFLSCLPGISGSQSTGVRPE